MTSRNIPRNTASQRTVAPSTGVAFCSLRISLLTLLLIVFGIAASPASAQIAGAGAITGVVADSTGAVIPNATVTATSVSTGAKVTRTTTGSGDYNITPLNPGMYTVTVAAPGFQQLVQQNVNVDALATVTLPIKLTIGNTSESVTVTEAPPQLSTTDATLGAVMENEMYSALPIEMGAYGQADQRRATDFVYLMPGVQGNMTNGNATTNAGIVNGSGSRGAVSAVYIDGLPFVRAGGNGDPRYVWTAISVDAVDQFQVQTSGYSAIYEGQGIQNYTIKAGGNRYHGSVYEFFRNTALDTWGFLGSVPNPATGVPVKPVEHSNEYGINLSGPLIPVGSWKDKLFFYGNYNGFRYTSATPTPMTFPTLAQQHGDFSAPGLPTIYDWNTSGACSAANGGALCRYAYPGNIIPSSQFSSVALKMQSYLPALSNQNLANNYVAANKTGLVNWSTTDRVDYNLTSKDTLTMVAAIGRQASSNPVGQTTAGRNVGPVPYNYNQVYAPKTAVGVIEETHIFSPHVVNQLKYGYARYNGPSFNASQGSTYGASSQGITGLPAGPAQTTFPSVTFASPNAPTNWASASYPNVTIAQNYTLLDNLQWQKGKHTLTFGGQIAWLLYNVNNSPGGSTGITLAEAVAETGGIKSGAIISGTGDSYASFLVGQNDKVSFTQYLQQVFGTRFRAISPYIQDNWKVSQKLTLDLGVRYDFFPTLTEVHNAGSFFNPNLANPATGINGALQYTGTGPNTCNCSTPVSNYYKNIGPRVGLAYQVDPKTVIRASYGVMFTHGNAVGGLATSLGGPTVGNGTLGFSAAPTFSSSSSTFISSAPFTLTNGAIPSYTPAAGVASGPAYGTGYTTTSGFTGTPSSMGYADPYIGGRAPEYINYTFGFQHEWTNDLVTSITYVGSQGHFLQTDGGNPRGLWADQLDPKYLSLGSSLTNAGSNLSTFCQLPANSGICPAYYKTFTGNQALSQLLKPFPFQTVTDAFGYVANANYNALQVTVNKRVSHGLTFMANYTWSRSIDDGGTFRSGYAIPAAYSNNGQSWAADRIERSVSTSNQPQHLVITGVWDLPLGKSVLGGNAVERAIFGGYKVSEIFQAFSGSPLPITGSTCQTNPSGSTCAPMLNPNYAGTARVNGKWGQGITAANLTAISYIAPSAGNCTSTQPTGPFINPVSTCLNTAYAPAYTFGNSPRTAPYNLYGPGNYQLDLALVRDFPLHFTEAARLNLRAEMYNVTNKTFFAVSSSAVGNAAFGTVTTSGNYNRRAVQLSGRINF
jgi:Carboxypeptidase regulatory-like domain